MTVVLGTLAVRRQAAAYTNLSNDSSGTQNTYDTEQIAATGYTVQMFTEGKSGKPCMISAELLNICRKRWKAGEFKCLETK